MIQQLNEEGISLITGAPTYESYQTWRRYQFAPLQRTNTNDSVGKKKQVSNISITLPTESLEINNQTIDEHFLDIYIFQKRNKEIKLGQIKLNKSLFKQLIYTGGENDIICGVLKDGGLFMLKNDQNFDFEMKYLDDSISTIIKKLVGKNNKETWFWGNSRIPNWICIDYICCGEDHICCVSDEATGKLLFSWGNNNFEQCGIKNVSSVNTPTLVTGLPGEVIALACGAQYTTCVTLFEATYSLYSWGVQPNLRLVCSVPHVDMPKDSPFDPLISFVPGNNNSALERPFKFWTESLSKWLVDTDKKWVQSFSGRHGYRLDCQIEDDISAELQNAKSRYDKMKNALQGEISVYGLFIDDPAPHEIQKTLATLDFQLIENDEESNLLSENENSFLKDIENLKVKRKKLAQDLQVYQYLNGLWEESPEIDESKFDDQDILYCLLEDCRSSSLSYLSQQEVFLHPKVTVRELITKSQETLLLVKQGLDALDVSDSCASLHQAVARLHEQKVNINTNLLNDLDLLVHMTSVPTIEKMNLLLETQSDMFDLSGKILF